MTMPTSSSPFGGLQPPEPPQELRRRALEGARSALVSDRGPDLWVRIWSNRALRLAWAATVVALLLANVTLSLRPQAGTSDAALPVARLSDEAQRGELAAVADLPAISLDTIEPPAADRPGAGGAPAAAAPPRLEGAS